MRNDGTTKKPELFIYAFVYVDIYENNDTT